MPLPVYEVYVSQTLVEVSIKSITQLETLKMCSGLWQSLIENGYYFIAYVYEVHTSPTLSGSAVL